MNNAIEHSGGDKIIFSLQKDPLYTEISIVDNGVGIFRNTKMEGMGTMAVMKLENEAVRTSAEVFDEFAPLEEGFVKTLIPMRDMCPLGNPVARSQARRILRRLEEFWEIIFDFREIGFMGQGFADEVFRVFQNMHPEIKLTVVNANAAVEGMIRHVRRKRSAE